MTGRFLKLFELSSNLYAPGVPVIVKAGVLLKDTETDTLLVQLKFQSLSPLTVKAVKVYINVFDISGKELGAVPEYQYLDLSVSNGSCFGSDKAIIIPDNVARSFAVDNIEIVLENGEIKKEHQPFENLVKLEALSSVLKNEELRKQYRLATNKSARYVPVEKNDIWCCACGTWNSGDICANCKAAKKDIFESFDIASLTKMMQERLTEEEREYEALKEKKLAEENEKKTELKKRKRKRIVLTLVAILFLILSCTIYIQIDKSKDYEAGEKALVEKQYDVAVSIFSSLGNYKDSNDKVKESKYNYAMDLIDSKHYAEAKDILLDINGYKNSSVYIDLMEHGINYIYKYTNKSIEKYMWVKTEINSDGTRGLCAYKGIVTGKNSYGDRDFIVDEQFKLWEIHDGKYYMTSDGESPYSLYYNYDIWTIGGNWESISAESHNNTTGDVSTYNESWTLIEGAEAENIEKLFVEALKTE